MADTQKPTKAWGIAGLILGILSLILFLAPYFGLPLAIAAIVFYGVQKKHQPTGPATAGLVTGIIGVVINSIALIFVVGILAFAGLASSAHSNAPATQATQGTAAQGGAVVGNNTVVSRNFSDFGTVYCNPSSTDLQKKTLFNDKFAGNYVRWSGTVGSIQQNGGNYVLYAKLCGQSLSSDIEVTMLPSQKNALLALSEGDPVTFEAHLKSMNGVFVQILADHGQLIS